MTIVTHDVPRHRIFITYFITRASHFRGSSRKRNAKILINRLHESGAVRTICQTGSSPDIGIADKLTGIIDHSLSAASHLGRFQSSLCFCLCSRFLCCFLRLFCRNSCLFFFPGFRIGKWIRNRYILSGYPAIRLACTDRIPAIYSLTRHLICLIFRNLCQDLIFCSRSTSHIQHVGCNRRLLLCRL